MSDHTKEPWSSLGACTINRMGPLCAQEYLGCFSSFRDAGHAVACVNACAGLNPKAIPTLIEACEDLAGYDAATPAFWKALGRVPLALKAVKEANDDN